MFVHKDDQLQVAHLILEYTPLSSSFQVPKCIIKAKDPRLHQISVAILGFLIIDPILEGIPKVALPSQRTAEEEATSSLPTTKEKEEVVKVSESEDDFEVFNRSLSPETLTGDPGHLPPTPASHAQEDSSILEDIGIQ